MSDRYNEIFEWKMTETEAMVFKMAIIWEELTKKLCPECKMAKLPTKSDPRRCTLFRECWKLVRLTRGLLKPEEYKLYIKANLTILVANDARIEPNVLSGDSAWVRWCVWKRLYDRKVMEHDGKQVVEKLVVDPKIVKELDCTKLFLFEKCDGEPTFEKIKSFFDKKKMTMWAGGKVSYFYLVLSPWVAKIIPLEELGKKIGFDPNFYNERISDDVRKFFAKEFKHEV